MKLDVLYFGVSKDYFGGERDRIDLAEGSSVGDLLELLEARNDASRVLRKTLAVAVNREYSALDKPLKDGDEVALLPPVSGGCCAN